ncbi:MAG TPA: protein kinase [Terriglobales bacterium]|nr:protein kinase [Terriglobales bacterium]
MDSLEHTPNPFEKQDKAQVDERPSSKAALCVRLWEYPGPQEKLRDLDCAADETVAGLIRNVFSEGQGKVSEVRGSTLIAQFENPLRALAAAKTLQVKLLTFHRNPPACQIVAAVMVHSTAQAAPSSAIAIGSPLSEINSAQILVSEKIYETAKNIPGFQFSVKPFSPAAQGAEALYELLWTDESTYSHVRKAGQIESVNPTAANRYQLQSELGRGAMGIVYKAYDNVIGRTVALKTISIQRNFGDGVELVDRLKIEAKAAGGLDHPNIITIYDIGQQDGFVYLSMQFVEGQTLANLLDAGKLPPLATLLSYADQMCSAVGFAHQRGVIHRDLKPANFMLTADGVVKVLDFGIAKFGDTNMTLTGVVVGTPTYMAPEQATGKKLDQRSDVYSLGTVFYELFTREKPFKGEIAAVLYKLIHEEPTPPSVINPSLPNGIDLIIRKALAKNPADRYQSCEEMRDAFREQAALLKSAMEPHVAAEQGTQHAPVQPRPLSSTRMKAVEPPRRRANPFGWLTVIALLLLVATIGWALHVKSRTGSFPSVAGRTITITRVEPKPAVANQSAEATSATDTQAGTTGPQASDPNADSTKAAAETSQAATDTTAGAQHAGGVTVFAQPPASGDAHASSSQGANPEPATAPPTSVQAPSTVSDSPRVPVAKNNVASAKINSEQAASSDDESTTEAPLSAPERHVRPRIVDSQEVEGFTRKDIPDLLRKADAAAGAGDYPLARYEYQIVLRLDHLNAAARNGLARVRAAREERLGR